MLHKIRYTGYAVAVVLSLTAKAQTGSLREVSLDPGWKFHQGPSANAHLRDFDDSAWQMVCLPHDWSAGELRDEGGESPFSKESIGQGATGFTTGGEGWYRRSFAAGDGTGHYELLFEGVYMESEVWVNGRKAVAHVNGYTPFTCDISEFVIPGKENIMAVRVVNRGKNSRWYSGSGIYRKVWLIHTGEVYFKGHAAWVHTKKISSRTAATEVYTEICNKTRKKRKTEIRIEIISPSGDQIAAITDTLVLSAGQTYCLVKPVTVANPQLWSVNSPVLYTARFSLRADDGTEDRDEVPFGIRTIAFSAEKGFLLNGVPLKLKGGCLHHDNGLLGAAAISRAEERKVELLKANGFNAVRCAHNPPSKAFLDACDQQGLAVIDEAFDQWQKPKNPDDYHRFFAEDHKQALTAMIRSDRNHPSVILWSIGNEIPERADSAGVEIARKLISVIRQLDPSRPVTAAVNYFWDNPGKTWADSKAAFSMLDVAGYNYMWYEYEKDHARFPERVMYGSESVPGEAARNWDLVEAHSYIIGDFVWTAMDYLGEAGIGHTAVLGRDEKDPQFMGWPWFNAWCGDIDICGDEKPQSFLRDVLWGERQLAIAVQKPVHPDSLEKTSYWGWPDERQSWNWKGHERQPLIVRVYSKPGDVLLYLNGRRIGERRIAVNDVYTASFAVLYEPGTLKAVRKGNSEVSAELRTTGAVSTLRLLADRNPVRASTDDLIYVKIEALDQEGNVVPDAQNRVWLRISGEGTLAGTGNASPVDMKSFRSLSPKLFSGKALAIIRPGGAPGKIRLRARAEGLPETEIILTTQ